jgi:hypothetical protein
MDLVAGEYVDLGMGAGARGRDMRSFTPVRHPFQVVSYPLAIVKLVSIVIHTWWKEAQPNDPSYPDGHQIKNNTSFGLRGKAAVVARGFDELPFRRNHVTRYTRSGGNGALANVPISSVSPSHTQTRRQANTHPHDPTLSFFYTGCRTENRERAFATLPPPSHARSPHERGKISADDLLARPFLWQAQVLARRWEDNMCSPVRYGYDCSHGC